MAAPPEVTSRSLTGRFVMNKSLSDDPDQLLALQGLSWFTRKAISFATVNLTIKSYEDDQKVPHIDITSVASGLSTTQENRTLDWTDRPHKDKIFGNVVGRSRFISLSLSGEPFEPCEKYDESDFNFLQGKTLKDGKTETKFLEEDAVQSYVKNQDDGYGWSAEQVWSFETVGKESKRYYTRRVVARDRDGTKTERVRLVYDYLGPATNVEDHEDDVDGEEEQEEVKVVEEPEKQQESQEVDGLAYGDADVEPEPESPPRPELEPEEKLTREIEKRPEVENKSMSELNEVPKIEVVGPSDSEDWEDTETVVASGSERAIDLNIVDAGHAVESDDDGTSTDHYDADTSEAEPGPGPMFSRERYGEVTGGMSEMSIMDTVICVGFGYALVYSS